MESNSNEYLQSFLTTLQKDEKAKKALEAKLLEGVRSTHIVADEQFWTDLKREIFENHLGPADARFDEA